MVALLGYGIGDKVQRLGLRGLIVEDLERELRYVVRRNEWWG